MGGIFCNNKGGIDLVINYTKFNEIPDIEVLDRIINLTLVFF
jgi:hypothetical protein